MMVITALRSIAWFLTGAVCLSLGACSTTKPPLSSPMWAPSSLVLTMQNGDSTDVGLLTLRRDASDATWELANTRHDSAHRETLRSGRCAPELIGEVSREIATGWAPCTGHCTPPSPGQVAVHVRILSSDARPVEFCRFAHSGDAWSELLPSSKRFEELWYAAAGIPKKYWYRFLGSVRIQGEEYSASLRAP